MRRLSACNAQAGTQTGLVKDIPRNPTVKSSRIFPCAVKGKNVDVVTFYVYIISL